MIAGMSPEWNPVSHRTGVRPNQSVCECVYMWMKEGDSDPASMHEQVAV